MPVSRPARLERPQVSRDERRPSLVRVSWSRDHGTTQPSRTHLIPLPEVPGMKSLRNPLLLALLIGGVIGYVAACNNAKPTTDVGAAPAKEPEKEVVSNDAQNASPNEPADPPSPEPVQVAQAPTADATTADADTTATDTSALVDRRRWLWRVEYVRRPMQYTGARQAGRKAASASTASTRRRSALRRVRLC